MSLLWQKTDLPYWPDGKTGKNLGKNPKENFLYRTVWAPGYSWYAYKVKMDLKVSLGLKNAPPNEKPENRIFTQKNSPGTFEKKFPLRILDFGYKKA